MLSVVIATQNRDWLLYNSLQAWRHQTYNDIEIIVVNDGGEASVNDICRPFAAEVVHLAREPRRKNPSVAWSEGIVRSRGDVVACTHAEIVPEPQIAAYLYGACTGDGTMCSDMGIWQGKTQQPVDVDACKGRALRANVPVLRMHAEATQGRDWVFSPREHLWEEDTFWTRPTEFGGHSNNEIRGFVGFFWNNLFAMPRVMFDWIHYFAPLRSWGADDSDFQRRNTQLQIPYVFPRDLYGYHQYHDAAFRMGAEDASELGSYNSVDEARLCSIYGGWGDPPPLVLEPELPELH